MNNFVKLTCYDDSNIYINKNKITCVERVCESIRIHLPGYIIFVKEDKLLKDVLKSLGIEDDIQ